MSSRGKRLEIAREISHCACELHVKQSGTKAGATSADGRVEQEGSPVRFCSRYSLASGICHRPRCRRQILAGLIAGNRICYHDLTFDALLSSVSYKHSYARSSLIHGITRHRCMSQVRVFNEKAPPTEFVFSAATIIVAVDIHSPCATVPVPKIHHITSLVSPRTSEVWQLNL